LPAPQEPGAVAAPPAPAPPAPLQVADRAEDRRRQLHDQRAAAETEQAAKRARAAMQEFQENSELYAAFVASVLQLKSEDVSPEALSLLLRFREELEELSIEARQRCNTEGSALWAEAAAFIQYEATNALLTNKQVLQQQDSDRATRRNARHNARRNARRNARDDDPAAFWNRANHFDEVPGGISGSLSKGAQAAVAFALAGYRMLLLGGGRHGGLHEVYRISPRSIVADFGCGSGMQLLALACHLCCELVLGLEVGIPHLVTAEANITRAIARLRKSGKTLRTRIALAFCNIEQVRSFEPVTHVFCYLGSVEMATALTRAVAHSKTLVAVMVVLLYPTALSLVLDHQQVEGGYVPSSPTEAVITLESLKCPNGNAYNSYVIPISPGRKLHAAQRLADAEREGRIPHPHPRTFPLPEGDDLKVFV
jgi:hypothetical protein